MNAHGPEEHGHAVSADRTGEALVDVRNLSVTYQVPAGRLQAVSDISFTIEKGETLGLVGESGCGKSTVGRALVCLPQPEHANIIFEGVDIANLSKAKLRKMRTRMQIIFQDPTSALNGGRKISEVVAEPFVIWNTYPDKAERKKRVDELLHAVGLDPEVFGNRRAHELSGGQCQRVAIARALALEPSFIVCDEAVSALDVSVQAQILNLLEELKEKYQLTLLFISHDLSVIRHVSDRICVMYLGVICEIGPRDAVYDTPRHPYTSALIDSLPEPDPTQEPQRPPIEGDLPSAVSPPPGCRFHTRCPRATAVCRTEVPPLVPFADAEGHFVACHHPLEPGEKLVRTDETARASDASALAQATG
ncbi:ABC transporter ATP-binding protein [Dactylosporangium roseum]|uniref:ABC transporter ATP-binding protein n=1 Tax=Dactylosporangium roseum TaxID=47989 RepID=A0ABY5ZAS2_9ACTN|nr:ABC transporter ATP-binding protein [Dactylosporangium roseum]UWZ39186.1 ABC transporter ATP-binding protein [Dactylosporangium roseum]